MALPRWKVWLKRAVKAAVAVLVLWAVGRHVSRNWHDIRQHDVALRVQPGWLVASGFLYLAGLCCSGRFYGGVLQASSTPIGMAPAVRAYLISHLGKYVPGKAMVVIMRAGLSVPYGTRAATAAIATFYETLVMMTAGGLVAGLGFALAGRSPAVDVSLPGWGRQSLPIYLLAGVLGLGLGLAFLAVVLPPVFRGLALLFSTPFPRVGPEALPRFTGRLLVAGILWSTGSWVFLGSSQLAVAQAFLPPGQTAGPSLLPVVTASVALATVAGFVVAVLPGGLGVREGVLMVALGPSLGQGQAVVAALTLRLVWVAAEVLAAAVLMPLGARYRREVNLEAQASTNLP
ncbi:MAG: lysylphosphatidylglycerol synthase domain-containing protein [Isosphaeraceae bacterium]